MHSIPAIDIKLALQQAGGSRELADELFAMLLRELPVFEQGIRAAYARHDLATLQRTVHQLHGATVYCGVPALKLAAESLETSLKRHETGRLEQLLRQIYDELSRVQRHAHERLPPDASQ